MDRERLNKLTKHQLLDLTYEMIVNKNDLGREALYDMIERIENQKEEEEKQKKYANQFKDHIREVNSAIKGFTKSYEIQIIYDIYKILGSRDLFEHLTKSRVYIKKLMIKLLIENKGFKFNESLKLTLSKNIIIKRAVTTITSIVYFNSKTQIIMNNNEIKNHLDTSMYEIFNKFEKWVSDGSQWSLKSIDSHFINTAKYKPLNANSYIKLPDYLSHSRKGLINLKNNDNECFRWSHIRYLNPKNIHPGRIHKDDYEFINKLNYSNCKFPISINDYNKIEKQNNINIYVFYYEDNDIYPLYISKENFENHLKLLLLTENENQHYVLISDFNRLMYNKTKHKCKKYFCMYCLQSFSQENILENHIETCIQVNGIQAIKMPDEDNKILKFNSYYKQLPSPFVIYADFESITEKIHYCKQDNKNSYTEKYQNHIDCGYGYKLVCFYDDKYSKPIQLYRGQKAVYKFLEKMLEEVEYCKNIIKNHFNKKINMSEDDKKLFKESKKCHICNIKFQKDDEKVKDYCYISGKYRGAAHVDCNLKLKIESYNVKIPVIFHNLRGYDSHFIIQEIGKIVKKHKIKDKNGDENEMNISIIPNNMERYMAFMLGRHLKFIDSFQFMNSSLEKLVSNLNKDQFYYTSKIFKGEKFDMMTKKGVYPYDYMDSFEKFDERKLPSKEEFYSLLNDQDISDDDYNHAKNVWKLFKIQNMGQYHDLYLKSDVMLLSDVFQNFRKICLKYYKLDPCHYFSSPGLSWDAMLKMTNIELELMTDVDMLQFVEKGKRGGLSYITHRYSKANNKYLSECDYNSTQKYITYLDANNLYGWAMSQYLPTGGFKWINKDKFNDINLYDYTENSKKGLLLEVDLEYPYEIHDMHNDYPLAPEKINVKTYMLSNYCLKIAKKYKISNNLICKLIPTLNNKEKYVIHYRNLQLYTELGLKITKIHRVLEFNQSPWLKKYIDFNTEKRKQAVNTFESDFFKLMNNSVYGKTMENLRKRVNVKLITNQNKLLKCVSKPTFVTSKIINEDLVVVHQLKETITMNRPIYIGVCILDLSKTLMYDFHYNYIKKKYNDKAKLLFTDTDSLTYEITCNDLYNNFWNDKDKFDFSYYPENCKFYDKTNKKVIGKFKDETSFYPIQEYIGLKSKMYSYVLDNKNGDQKAKGIKKNVIKKDIKHDDYKETLFGCKQLHHIMKTIRSINHKIGSYEINKISLSCYDDKRYIQDDGISTYAYGHYAIGNEYFIRYLFD